MRVCGVFLPNSRQTEVTFSLVTCSGAMLKRPGPAWLLRLLLLIVPPSCWLPPPVELLAVWGPLLLPTLNWAWMGMPAKDFGNWMVSGLADLFVTTTVPLAAFSGMNLASISPELMASKKLIGSPAGRGSGLAALAGRERRARTASERKEIASR